MKKFLSLFLTSLAILLTVTGCGNAAADSTGRSLSPTGLEQSISENPPQITSQSSSQSGSQSSSKASSQKSSQESPSQASSQKQSQKSSSQVSSKKSTVPDEHGTYDSAQDVADYLLYYHKLPENYMTKSEARKKGWESGALNRVIPGKCIGGDEYLNLEGRLPKNATYHECDIDTINKAKRGSKRLVWSDDFKIYYTKDHYETFEYVGG